MDQSDLCLKNTMASKRKFYKTIIEVEILSEEPYTPEFLEHVAADIKTGDHSGVWGIRSSEEIDAPTTAKLLQEHASDSEFFRLDTEGNDIE